MNLEKYRKISSLTYSSLSKFLGFSYNKTYRICKENPRITLQDAKIIHNKTGGKVSFSDLGGHIE